jgi:hypothetical protein
MLDGPLEMELDDSISRLATDCSSAQPAHSTLPIKDQGPVLFKRHIEIL